jgi:hypothetical protein
MGLTTVANKIKGLEMADTKIQILLVTNLESCQHLMAYHFFSLRKNTSNMIRNMKHFNLLILDKRSEMQWCFHLNVICLICQDPIRSL